MAKYLLEIKKQAVNDYISGMTARQISAKYGPDKCTILVWVKKFAGKDKIKPPNGYTEELKNQVVEDYAAGHTSPSLGKKYGLDPKTVTEWVKASGIFVRNLGSRPLVPLQTAEEKKAHREKNKEKLSLYNKKWHRENRSYMREYERKYRKINRNRINALYRTEKYKIKARKRQSDRYRNDPQFRLRCRLRRRIRSAVGDQKTKKIDSTISLIGCSLDYLKTYLINKFTKDMTWELFMEGKVHIDHIRPCVSFDLTNPTEQRKCFHYTNLQPLWPEDNSRKGDRWDNSND